nr:DUF6768 family protein [Aestuariivivens sp. NBU2969]
MAECYGGLEKQNVFKMLCGLFQGMDKWIIYLINIRVLVFFGLFVYNLVQFFNTNMVNEFIKWGMGKYSLFVVVSMLMIFACI